MSKSSKHDIAFPLHGAVLAPISTKDAAIIKLEYLNSTDDLDDVVNGRKQPKSLSLSLSAAQIDDLVRILGNAAAEIREDKQA